MAQLMPLPLTVSCFSKMQIGFTFLVPAHLGSREQGVCVRVPLSWAECLEFAALESFPVLQQLTAN